MTNFREKDWFETETYYNLEKRSLDWKEKSIKSRFIFIHKQEGQIGDVLIDLRLYDARELEDLLMKVNLKVTDIFGSPEKEEFHETRSREILLVSRKS